MRTTKILIMAISAILVLSVGCNARDKIITVDQLPAMAQTFLKKHFANNKLLYAKKDFEISGSTYEVRLEDGTEIEFDKKGNWDKVDCQMKAVPAELIPAAIAQYVTKNYTNAHIVKIDKERYGYEIELSNELELKFDKQFRLFDIDD